MDFADLLKRPWADGVLRTYAAAAAVLMNAGAPWVFLPSDVLFLTEMARGAPAGDFAEVGVYAGLSARMLCEQMDTQALYLYDTWLGIPYHQDGDAAQTGDFMWPMQRTVNFLAGWNVVFRQGIFPASALPDADRTFALTHLDADTYQTTRDGLEFFWPQLVPGGRIVIHDTHYLGPRAALAGFDHDGTVLVCGIQSALIKGAGR